MRRGDERGVALMLVVWLLIVLGLVAAGIARSSRAGSLIMVNHQARAAARYAAESGIAATVARLERLLSSARSPRARALLFRELGHYLADLREVEIGQARCAVALADLNARIDLNRSDERTLLAFFSRFADETEASSVVAALQDYKDGDDLARARGAEAADYARARSPFVPSNGPLRRLEEFRRIAGVTDELAFTVAEHITVHGDGRINPNTAPEPVLAALVGPTGARRLIAQREAGEVFTSAVTIEEALRRERGAGSATLQLTGLTFTPSRLLIVSRGWKEGHPLTHEIQAVYGIAGPRLILHSWEEREL